LEKTEKKFPMIGKTKKNGLLDLQTLFPSAVVLVSGYISDMGHEALWPGEKDVVANAVERRRMEYAAGRFCARTALHQLGQPACALIKSESGAVAWPEGLTGVISHTNEICAAAVVRQEDLPGLGLDLERIDRMNEQIAQRILTDKEQRWIQQQPAAQHSLLRTAIFCAKEAVYKCLNPITQDWIGYDDAEITLDTTRQTLQVHLSDRIARHLSPDIKPEGRYLFNDTLMAAGLWLHPNS